jgi:hypothetical protein
VAAVRRSVDVARRDWVDLFTTVRSRPRAIDATTEGETDSAPDAAGSKAAVADEILPTTRLVETSSGSTASTSAPCGAY